MKAFISLLLLYLWFIIEFWLLVSKQFSEVFPRCSVVFLYNRNTYVLKKNIKLFRQAVRTTKSPVARKFKERLNFLIVMQCLMNWVQQGLEIRGFWFLKKTLQLKTALHEVYIYVLKGLFFQKNVYLQGFCSKSVYLKVTVM